MAIIRANFAFYGAMATGLSSSSFMNTSSGVDNYIEIYSGSMPADADDWFPGYGGSPGAGSPLVQLLATFNNFTIDTDNTRNVQRVVLTTNYTPRPSTVNATATGTAAWYAMYDSGQEAVGWGGLLGDVSLSGGNGSLHLDSLSLVAGQPVQLLHWGVTFQA